MPPPYLSAISLRNFRGFKATDDVELAPLTFLVGPNSSGKSSVSDAMMLISQSNIVPDFYEANFEPVWMGELIDLGSFEDSVFFHNLNLEISIGFQLKMDPRSYYSRRLSFDNKAVKYEFKIRWSKLNNLSYVSQVIISDVTTGENLKIKIRPTSTWSFIIEINKNIVHSFDFPRHAPPDYLDTVYRRILPVVSGIIKKPGVLSHGKGAAWGRILQSLERYGANGFVGRIGRVSSGRSAPHRWYVPKSGIKDRLFSPFLSREVYDSLSPEMVDEALEDQQDKARRRPGRRSRNRQKISSLNKVLDELGIGNKIATTKYTPYHSILEIRDNVLGVNANVADVGYGASQVIPVIAACLSGEDSPLIVEQPEVHLHPKAQGVIGDLLCDTSRQRQVIVETHSPHLINRARIRVASGQIPASDVCVLYVSRSEKGAVITRIPIEPNGDFGAEWPKGFFDERYEDTMRLLELKRNVSKSSKR
tara:strand:+ start:646 stop:2076 length:1431 start_codon:yes stop_codon:yes gene_type:complete